MPDAVVVGAGICGAAVARCLADRGREVLVVDRDGIASGSTSRGEGNVLLCDAAPGPERELTLVSRELWEALGERHPAGRVTRTGSLLLHPAGSEAGEDGAAFEPALAPGVRVVHEPGDLMVDAPGMARALLDGLDVRTGASVTAIVDGGVTLDGGERVVARDVIVCAGAWSGPLTGLPVAPRKGQLVALAVDPAAAPLVRHKLVEAAYLDAAAGTGPGLAIASVIERTLDGDELLVGSSRERVGFDATVDPAVTRAMIERASRWVPALAGLEIAREWCGFRPWLPDRLPAIGALGDGVWTATGHEGAGVCLAPASGRLLAELICGEDPVCDPAPFHPRRFRAAGGGSAAAASAAG